MNRQPLLILLLCFIFGIILREYIVLSPKLMYSLLGCSAVLLSFIFIKSPFFQHVKYYVLGFFFVVLGFFLHSQDSTIPKLPKFKGKESIVFQLESKLNSNEKNKRYIIEIIDADDKTDLPVKSVISVPKDQLALDYQHYYKADVYINDVKDSEYDYQFNYKRFLARDQVYFQAYLPNDISVSKKEQLSFVDQIKQARSELLVKINHTSLSPKVQEFVKGIVLADRTEMDKETVNDFNQTGLVHLLAISGSHMVIIFMMISWVFNVIISFRFRRFSIVLSLICIWAFAALIDFGPSVSRSCLMITCYYAMVLLQRKSDLLHSLALSAFIILMIDTQQLFKAGFQLSYFAVLGIWWLTPTIQALFGKSTSKVYRFFVAIVAMTLAAQLGTLPLVIYYFHQFSVVSIFANLLIIPLAEIIIISSFLMVVLIAVGIKFDLLYQVFDFFISQVLSLIHWMSVSFDALMIRNIALNLTEVFVLMLLVYVVKFVLVNVRSLKNQLQFGLVVLMFLGIRLFYDVKEYQKNEVLIHHFFKEKIISIKENNKVYFWIPEHADREKIEQFIINPYLSERRTKKTIINSYSKAVYQFVYDDKKYVIN